LRNDNFSQVVLREFENIKGATCGFENKASTAIGVYVTRAPS